MNDLISPFEKYNLKISPDIINEKYFYHIHEFLEINYCKYFKRSF